MRMGGKWVLSVMDFIERERKRGKGGGVKEGDERGKVSYFV